MTKEQVTKLIQKLSKDRKESIMQARAYIATECGVAYTTVLDWQSGRRNPSKAAQNIMERIGK